MKKLLLAGALLVATPVALLVPGCGGGSSTLTPTQNFASNLVLSSSQTAQLALSVTGNKVQGTITVANSPASQGRSTRQVTFAIPVGTYFYNGSLTPPNTFTASGTFPAPVGVFTITGQVPISSGSGNYTLTVNGQTTSGTFFVTPLTATPIGTRTTPTITATTSATATTQATATARPTPKPTARPTSKPTARPTARPTVSPTGFPGITPVPTPGPGF